MTSNASEATEDLSSVIYLRIDESESSFGWEVRRYATDVPVLIGNRRFETEALARKDGQSALIRYASHNRD